MIEQYKQIFDEVPITNFGRFYVTVLFSIRVIRQKPTIIFGILNYWVRRLFKIRNV